MPPRRGNNGSGMKPHWIKALGPARVRRGKLSPRSGYKPWRPDGVIGILLGDAQVVQDLQIEPEICAGAEEVGQTQGCVCAYGALAVQDSGDSVSGYA